MKIIAFGASYSRESINRKFAGWAAGHFTDSDIELLDLNDYTVPVFTVDAEAETGYPAEVTLFIEKIGEADLLVVSMAEHNGSYTAAFKSLMDWSSRKEMKFLGGKKVLLLSASPGQRGGLNVIETAMIRFPIHGAEIVAHFSLPYFDKNFDTEKGITDKDLLEQFRNIVNTVKII